MTKYLKQVASPRILNEAWLDLPRDNNDWCGELSMPQMERNLIFHIGELSMQLAVGQYRPEPMCCHYAQKANGEQQLRCVSTVRDQLVQLALLKVLQPLVKPLFNPGNLAGQPGPQLALSQIQQWVNQDYVWLGIVNIKDCFDNIPHEAVLKNLYKLCGDKTLVNLVRSYLASWPTEYRPAVPGIGLPHGLLLSPFLCELYLHRFEAFWQNKRIPFVHFGDDLIVLAQQEVGAHQALKLADKQLKKMGLALNPQQSRVIFSSSDFDDVLRLKSRFAKWGLGKFDWSRWHPSKILGNQSGLPLPYAMANKGCLLLKKDLLLGTLRWLKTAKLAASQTFSNKQATKVWQIMWKRRASWEQ